MGIVLYHMGEIHLSITHYLLKYLIIPTVLNLLLILIGFVIMHREDLSQRVKIYIMSLDFVVICFVVFSVHTIFTALYFVFALPALLTIIYGSYNLTGITSIASIFSLTISELFVRWDSEKPNIFTSGVRLSDFILSLCILLAFSAVCMVAIRFEKEKNAASIYKEMERYKLKQKVQRDELTGIRNRTALRYALNEMEADDSDNTYIFAMIDLDNFKRLNDTYGHLFGDQCLIEFAKIIKLSSEGAKTFRFGGDEFCILFKNVTIEYVTGICKTIQDKLAKINLEKEVEFTLTASIGITKYLKNASSLRMLINTDKALYQSKANRNTIRLYEEVLD